MTFLNVFNASVAASWVVAAVILARLLLKKAPKAIHCALWALVAIRLLCPVSIESSLSLIPSAEIISPDYLTQDAALSSDPAVLDVVENPIYPSQIDIPIDTVSSHVGTLDVRWTALIWPAGMGAMALYALVSYLRVRRRVAASVPIGGDIRICDYVDSPFILGIARPRIYLPSAMDQQTLDQVLAHERAHLARKDHWWKPLGFALLTLHWFNPVMWLAYILLCRDIEMACDEKVIRQLDPPGRKAYTTALLACSVSRPLIAACPLAFGEVGVKARVRSVLHYRKPAFWVVLIALVLCAVVAVCFLTDPMSPRLEDIRNQKGYTILAQGQQHVELTVPVDALPEMAFTGDGHTFREKQVVAYETGESVIWLRQVMPANEGPENLYFEFEISYDLPDVGTILYPYRINADTTASSYASPTSARLYDDGALLSDSAVKLRGLGPGQRFTLYVNTEAVWAARDKLSMTVRLNQLTYARSGKEPTVFMGKASSDAPTDLSFQLSGSDAYAIGWHSRQGFTFLDPFAAYAQFTDDYAAIIARVGRLHSLEPLTALSGSSEYKALAWQSGEDAGYQAVSDFLDVYENSFLPGYEGPARSPQGNYRAAGLVAQYAALSSGYGESDMTFRVDYGRLTVWEKGREIFDSSLFETRFHTRKALRELMDQTMEAWNPEAGTFHHVTLDVIPEFEGLNMEILSYYEEAGAEYPSYALFYFNNELRWFATSRYHDFMQIFAVEPVEVSENTYRSQNQIYWPLFSSYLPGTMTMELGENTITVREEGGYISKTYPNSGNWVMECPIPRALRLKLGDYSDIEPALKPDPDRDCLYLVLDENAFLVEYENELYLVGWRDSTKALEIMQYIFHMVPESRWQPMLTLLTAEDPLAQTIAAHNPVYPRRPMYMTVSYEPITEALGSGPDGSFREIYAAARVAVMMESGGQWSEIQRDTFYVLARIASDGQVTAYWESNTDDWEDRPADIRVPIPDHTDPSDYTMALALDNWRQMADAGLLDPSAMEAQLRADHPACFPLSAEDGLEVSWRTEDGGFLCRMPSGDILTVPELIALLDIHGLTESSVTFTRIS